MKEFTPQQPSMPAHQKKQSRHHVYQDEHAPRNSEVSSLNGNNLNTKKDVNKLKTIIVKRFINDLRKVSMSLIAIDIPKPKIGPINGEINMAPITTAVEFTFNPMEAINTAKIKIHAVAPLNGISVLIASTVAS